MGQSDLHSPKGLRSDRMMRKADALGIETRNVAVGWLQPVLRAHRELSPEDSQQLSPIFNQKSTPKGIAAVRTKHMLQSLGHAAINSTSPYIDTALESLLAARLAGPMGPMSASLTRRLDGRLPRQGSKASALLRAKRLMSQGAAFRPEVPFLDAVRVCNPDKDRAALPALLKAYIFSKERLSVAALEGYADVLSRLSAPCQLQTASLMLQAGYYFMAVKVVFSNLDLLRVTLDEMRLVVAQNLDESNWQLVAKTWQWRDLDRELFLKQFRDLHIISYYLDVRKQLKALKSQGVVALARVEREMMLKVVADFQIQLEEDAQAYNRAQEREAAHAAAMEASRRAAAETRSRAAADTATRYAQREKHREAAIARAEEMKKYKPKVESTLRKSPGPSSPVAQHHRAPKLEPLHSPPKASAQPPPAAPPKPVIAAVKPPLRTPPPIDHRAAAAAAAAKAAAMEAAMLARMQPQPLAPVIECSAEEVSTAPSPAPPLEEEDSAPPPVPALPLHELSQPALLPDPHIEDGDAHHGIPTAHDEAAAMEAAAEALAEQQLYAYEHPEIHERGSVASSECVEPHESARHTPLHTPALSCTPTPRLELTDEEKAAIAAGIEELRRDMALSRAATSAATEALRVESRAALSRSVTPRDEPAVALDETPDERVAALQAAMAAERSEFQAALEEEKQRLAAEMEEQRRAFEEEKARFLQEANEAKAREVEAALAAKVAAVAALEAQREELKSAQGSRPQSALPEAPREELKSAQGSRPQSAVPEAAPVVVQPVVVKDEEEEARLNANIQSLEEKLQGELGHVADLEAEKRRVEAERAALEEAQAKLEEEKLLALAEKAKSEAEKGALQEEIANAMKMFQEQLSQTVKMAAMLQAQRILGAAAGGSAALGPAALLPLPVPVAPAMPMAAELDDPPTREEILEYAVYLGMDPEADAEHLYIAEWALTSPLPEGWTVHLDGEGNEFFYNAATTASTYEHPMDEHYKQYFKKMKDEAAAERAAAVAAVAAKGKK